MHANDSRKPLLADQPMTTYSSCDEDNKSEESTPEPITIYQQLQFVANQNAFRGDVKALLASARKLKATHPNGAMRKVI